MEGRKREPPATGSAVDSAPRHGERRKRCCRDPVPRWATRMPRTSRGRPPQSSPYRVPSPGSGYDGPSRPAHIAVGNPDLRRLGFSYALCCTAELGIWIALLIYAYADGGTAAGATIVLVQLVPCIVVGPFLGAVADVRDPQRVLIISGWPRSSAAASGCRRRPPAHLSRRRFTLAPTTALSITLTRPTQAALFPRPVVRTPEELTAANAWWVTTGAASSGRRCPAH